MNSINSAKIIETLQFVFSTHGLSCTIIVTDNSPSSPVWSLNVFIKSMTSNISHFCHTS